MADKKRKKRIAAKVAKAAKTAKSANGFKTSPREGPRLDVRLRNRDSKRNVERAAKAAGISVNTFVCDVLDKATSTGTSTSTQAS